MPVDIRLTEQARNQLTTLVRRTGIRQRNVLLRWAFCRSIGEATRIAPYDIPFDPDMPPIAWDTFAGHWGNEIWALLRIRVHADGLPLEDEVLRHQFLLHLHRGVGYLAGDPDVKDITGLVTTALRAADEADREEASARGCLF